MRYKNTVPPEQYDNRNRELHARIDAGETLSLEEQSFVCHCLKYKNLLQYSFCQNEWFSRTFLARNSDVPEEMYEVKEKDNIYYEGFVREWAKTVGKRNHEDQLLQIVAKETRDELKSLRKKYSFLKMASSWQDYSARTFKILEWSKYRYIMIKDVFELSIRADHYDLYLNEQRIEFDYYSLTHILTRHYGHIMKPYDTDKSHFTKDILHEEVHLALEEIFKKIDQSGYYKNDSVLDINVRIHGTLYKIYSDYIKKGNSKLLRLNTFFPIDNKQMLQNLFANYIEMPIDNILSVFLRV